MKSVEVECAACKVRLSVLLPAASVRTRCPECRSEIGIEAFPALFRPVAQGRPGEAVLVDDESTCFYHPKKRASVACDGCGRFLCDLCDVEMMGRHLCASCIETGMAKGGLTQASKRTYYYDEIALALAVVPLILLFYITPITAPVSLYIAIRHWRTPLSVLPRSRWRFVLAILFDVLEIVGWAAVLVYLLAAFGGGEGA